MKVDVTQTPSPESFLPLRTVEFHILLALAPRARHGYGILQDTLRRTGGKLLLEPGTLYRALRRLLADGLVEEGEPESGEADRDDERRRYYRLTGLGREVAGAEVERMRALVAAAQGSGLVPLREAAAASAKAASARAPGWRLKTLRGEKP